jgi:hypothetical protein
VAERYHVLPHPGEDGVHHRVHRRPLPLHHRPGRVPQSAQRLRGGTLPRGGGAIRGAQGDADRQRPAVRELARHDAVPEGTAEGPRASSAQRAAASDDAGEDRALLADPQGGVPVQGALRDLRGGAGAHRLVDAVLQPQATAPGDGRSLPGRPVLLDPEGDARGDRTRRGGQRGGTGATRQTAGAVLHGGPHGRAERGHRHGEQAHECAGGRARTARRPPAGVRPDRRRIER